MKNQKELGSQLQTKITLAYATKTLIERFDFETKTIWDPFATSNGDIAKVCIDAGYDVFSTNVVEFNWKLDMKLDYFECSKMPSRTGLSDDETDDFAIVTHPPYGFENKFFRNTFSDFGVQPKTCCVFIPVKYLEDIESYTTVYSKVKPCKILIYPGKFENNIQGVGSYMWLCFNQDSYYTEVAKPEIEWVL